MDSVRSGFFIQNDSHARFYLSSSDRLRIDYQWKKFKTISVTLQDFAGPVYIFFIENDDKNHWTVFRRFVFLRGVVN